MVPSPHARRLGLLAVAWLVASAGATRAQSVPADPPLELVGVARIQADARQLMPCFESEAARRFLAAAEQLQPAEPRTVYVNTPERRWLTPDEAAALPEARRAALEVRTIDEEAFYTTFYGSPLVYARVLEVAERAGRRRVPNLDLLSRRRCPGTRVLDFGYGSIGHLRLLGVERVVGVDVDHRLAAIYRLPEDVDRDPLPPITLVHARWPADAAAVEAVNAAANADNTCHLRPPSGFDLITSKNTLKNGYLHPEREVEKRLLVDLGVPHDRFLEAVFDALRPGGLFVIYNLSPRRSRDDEPYKPWADGRCPFPRAMLEDAGFEVLAYDENDDPAARAIFTTLGYPTTTGAGEPDLFALYTIARRPEPPHP